MSAHLAALRTLHDVCAHMDLAQEAKRPTEADYQAAMKSAAELLTKTSGNEKEFETLRPDFERLANKSAACGLKRSRKGTYINPAIARDWKWFQLGSRLTVAAPDLIDAAQRLERRGFFAPSTCADGETATDMALMRAAIARRTGSAS